MTAHVSITFQVERFADVVVEAEPLLRAHWDEIAQRKDLMWLNPDTAIYLKAEAAGRLLIVTARDCGKLIGYVVFFLSHHPHYRHLKTATEDIHFLDKPWRRGLAGYRLLKTACRLVLDHGADLVVMREKLGHEHAGVLERIGFRATDVVYTLAKGDLRS